MNALVAAILFDLICPTGPAGPAPTPLPASCPAPFSGRLYPVELHDQVVLQLDKDAAAIQELNSAVHDLGDPVSRVLLFTSGAALGALVTYLVLPSR